MTGDRSIHFHRDRLLPQQHLRDQLQGYLQTLIRNNVSRIWNHSGLFNNVQIIVEEIFIRFMDHNGVQPTEEGYLPPQGMDLGGHEVVLGEDDSYNIQFENDHGATYYIGMYFVEVPACGSADASYLAMNPRPPMQVEYLFLKEEVGFKADPSYVTKEDTRLIIGLDSVFEEGVDHSGRRVVIYLKQPVTKDDSVAFYTGTSKYSAALGNYVEIPYNLEEEVYPLGQGTNAASNPISENTSKYEAFVPGVTIRRNTDLSQDPDCIYIGSVLNEVATDVPDQYILNLQHDFTLDGGYDGPAGYGSGREIFVDNGAVLATTTSDAPRAGDGSRSVFHVRSLEGSYPVSYLSEHHYDGVPIQNVDFMSMFAFDNGGAFSHTQQLMTNPNSASFVAEAGDYSCFHGFPGGYVARLTFGDGYEEYNDLYFITMNDPESTTLYVKAIGLGAPSPFPAISVPVTVEFFFVPAIVGMKRDMFGITALGGHSSPGAAFAGFSGTGNLYRIPFLAIVDSNNAVPYNYGFALVNTMQDPAYLFAVDNNGTVHANPSMTVSPEVGLPVIKNSPTGGIIDFGNPINYLLNFFEYYSGNLVVSMPDVGVDVLEYRSDYSGYTYGGFRGSMFISNMPENSGNYPSFISVRSDCAPEYGSPYSMWTSYLLGILSSYPSPHTFTGMYAKQWPDAGFVFDRKKGRIDYGFQKYGVAQNDFPNETGAAVNTGTLSLNGRYEMEANSLIPYIEYNLYAVWEDPNNVVMYNGVEYYTQNSFLNQRIRFNVTDDDWRENTIEWAAPNLDVGGMYDKTAIAMLFGANSVWGLRAIRNDTPAIDDDYGLPYQLSEYFKSKAKYFFMLSSTGEKLCLDSSGNLLINGGNYLRAGYHYCAKNCLQFVTSVRSYVTLTPEIQWNDTGVIKFRNTEVDGSGMWYGYSSGGLGVSHGVPNRAICSVDDIPDGARIKSLKLYGGVTGAGDTCTIRLVSVGIITGLREVIAEVASDNVSDPPTRGLSSIDVYDDNQYIQRSSYSYFLELDMWNDGAVFYDAFIEYYG